MKIILDENLPKYLKRVLTRYQVTTVQEEGWSGISNGELIERIDLAFDVLLTADKNLRYQQNLSGRTTAIIELPTNRLPVLKALEPRLLEALGNVTPGSYLILGYREP